MNVRRPRYIAALVALVVTACVLALPVPVALAEGSLIIEPTDGVERDYQAWRVLAGGVTEDGRSLYDAAYTNAMPAEEWQSLGAPKGNAQAVTDWLDKNSSPVVANEVSWSLEDSGVSAAATGTRPSDGNGVVAFESLEDGLWLVSSSDSSPVLVLVGGGSTRKVTEKAEEPALQKQVRLGEGEWASTVIAPVGTSLEYRLVGTLPRNYDSFPTYSYRFDDSSESGIAVDPSSVRVELGGVDITSAAHITCEPGSLSVAFDDLKTQLPSLGTSRTVTVTYSAKLVPGATAGLMDTNDNRATLTYPAKPTRGSSTQGASARTVPVNHGLRVATSTTGGLTGTTEAVQCSVITWRLKVTKTNADTGDALEGAGFTIQRQDGSYLSQDGTSVSDSSQAYVWHTGDDGTFEFIGAGNETLTVTEVEAPDGYDVAKPFSVTFDGSASDFTATVDGCTLDSVDAASGTAAVTVTDQALSPVNKDANEPLEKPLGLPITGDTAVALGVALVVAGAGIVAILAARHVRRGDKE